MASTAGRFPGRTLILDETGNQLSSPPPPTPLPPQNSTDDDDDDDHEDHENDETSGLGEENLV